MFIASTLHLTPKYIDQKYRFKNGNKTFFALKIGPKIENSICPPLSLLSLSVSSPLSLSHSHSLSLFPLSLSSLRPFTYLP